MGIKDLIIVANKGINSKLNLKKIIEKGCGYIFAYRLRSANEKVKEEINKGNFTEIADDESNDNFKYKVINYINKINKTELFEKLIINYSDKRTKRDRIDRERNSRFHSNITILYWGSCLMSGVSNYQLINNIILGIS